ncbi:MAG: pilus assembly protein TadG-related protein, partial [Planctomycetia bacterium]
MHLRRNPRSRRGMYAALFGILLIPMMALVALSIDVGIMFNARTEAQDVADASALVGARSINTTARDTAVVSNVSKMFATSVPDAHRIKIINKQLSMANNVTMKIGTYRYVTASVPTPEFRGFTTLANGQMPTLVQATVRYKGDTFFGKVFSASTYDVSTVATAIHRPRDISIVMDLSGSMRFGSNVGASNVTPNEGVISGPLTSDSRVPQFGHYTTTSPSSSRRFHATSPYTRTNGEVYGVANFTFESDNGAAIIDDFVRAPIVTPPATEPTGATTSAFGSGLAIPGDGKANSGDTPLRRNFNATGQNYSSSLHEILYNVTNSSATTTQEIRRATRLSGPDSDSRATQWESAGYEMQAVGGTPGSFKGFTEGPGHWGKTFWIWPPDPRSTFDWRRKFFTYPGATNPIDYNNRLYNSSNGQWRGVSSSSYEINYQAILDWIRQSPNPFPNYLRCDRIVYYTNLAGVSMSGITYSSRPTNNDQRFWKEYIDFVIAARGHSATGNDWDGNRPNGDATEGASTEHMGSGADFPFGSTADGTFIRPQPTSGNNGGHPPTYMDYRDNPFRPQTHFWFGGYTMLDFVQRRFGYPGSSHEAQNWQLKVGVRSAIRSIQENYPNDNVALMFFSGEANYRSPQVSMGQDFDRLVDALFHPKNTLASKSTIFGYSSENFSNGNVPRALGSTCPAMGFLLAFNQFSANPNLITGVSGLPANSGGSGRRGAQKTCIFLTDGAPNSRAAGTFVSASNGQSYYHTFSGANGLNIGEAAATDPAVALVTQTC